MKPFDEFPISISAYIADTQHLSTLQHGAYLLLLMTMRRAGGWIADDERKIANIVKLTVAKWRSIAPDIRSLLVSEGGRLSQKRVLSDIEKQEALRLKNASNGKQGGIAKSLKTKDADMANANFSPDHRQPDRHIESVNAIPSSLFKDSEEEIPKKERNGVGKALPSDWVPTERDLAYGAKLNLTVQEVEACAEDMRLWARANANRAVGRKADWPSTFHGWMRREAPKIIRARGFNNGGWNGTNRGGSGQKLGYAGIARAVAAGRRSGDTGADASFPGIDDADVAGSDGGFGIASRPLGAMDRARPTAHAPPAAPRR